MNPEDSMPNAASETVEQTTAVEKQMGAEDHGMDHDHRKKSLYLQVPKRFKNYYG